MRAVIGIGNYKGGVGKTDIYVVPNKTNLPIGQTWDLRPQKVPDKTNYRNALP